MAHKGETWNESKTYRDAWTLREVRQITTQGLYNQTPTYHTNVGFSEDGEYLVFASARDGMSAIFAAHVPTGDITQLIDPIDGIGGYGSLQYSAGSAMSSGKGVIGSMCIAPRSGWVAFCDDEALRAVQLGTLKERVLIPHIGKQWMTGMPSIDPAEEHVVISVTSAHPELMLGQRPTKGYMEHFAGGGMKLEFWQVPLAGGPVEVIYREDNIGCSHNPHCPADGDLLLIDRDFPPKFWGGSDGRTNRIWTLRISTQQLTELPPRDQARFQVHSAWTWDGEGVVYHGRSAVSGHYIGVVNKRGETVREYLFDKAPHYGHVSAMAGRPAIILDGNLSTDLLLWLYYDQEQPRIEVIARHETEWNSIGGQFPHPHPLCDPAGRYISFNAAHRGRSDVYAVTV